MISKYKAYENSLINNGKIIIYEQRKNYNEKYHWKSVIYKKDKLISVSYFMDQHSTRKHVETIMALVGTNDIEKGFIKNRKEIIQWIKLS